MAELLPDNLATSTETQPRLNKSQRQAISNIFKWIKCFSIYIAVVSSKQPHIIPDLLGYLILIMKSHVEHAGEGWIGYGRRFREIVATKPNVVWAQIDTTLWNIAFSRKATSARCKFCFILLQSVAGHLSKDHHPQNTSTYSKHQHNHPSTLDLSVVAEYACSITMNLPLDVPSLIADLIIFAAFVLMTHVPLISATRL